MPNLLITARKRSLGQGNIFALVCHSVHGGGAWSRGSAPVGCLVPRGVCSGGVVLGPEGVPDGETPREGYCCGRYASYWNAFLFGNGFAVNCIKMKKNGPRGVRHSSTKLLRSDVKNIVLGNSDGIRKILDFKGIYGEILICTLCS